MIQKKAENQEGGRGEGGAVQIVPANDLETPPSLERRPQQEQ